MTRILRGYSLVYDWNRDIQSGACIRLTLNAQGTVHQANSFLDIDEAQPLRKSPTIRCDADSLV